MNVTNEGTAVRPVFGGTAASTAVRPACCKVLRAMATPHAFARLFAYIEQEADNLKVLQCFTLKDSLLTGKATTKRKGRPEQYKHYNFFLVLEQNMSAEQREV